ncbi:MAG: PKD domain-containing protein [Nitrospirota bacterium]
MVNSYLSEISFKDKTSDWIEISVNSDILSPLLVKDDGKIAEINPISDVRYILIHFKSESEKTTLEDNTFHIYTTKSGLTGTTEQITLESDSKIIDSVCWQNSSPTESELEDIKDLNLVGKCINSEDISANQSIAKTANGWEIHKHPTPAAENIYYNSPPTAKIIIQKGDTESEVPFSINLASESNDPDNDPLSYKWTFPDQIIEKENPKSYRFETSGAYEISLTVTDPEGLSSHDSIQINALNSAEDLQSAALLEKIVTKTHPSPLPKTDDLPTWFTILIFYAIFCVLILRKVWLTNPTY